MLFSITYRLLRDMLMISVLALLVALSQLRRFSPWFQWPVLRMLNKNTAKFDENFRTSVATFGFVRVSSLEACPETQCCFGDATGLPLPCLHSFKL